MRVLGVDPGTVVTGWGLVDERPEGLRWVASGVIRARGAIPQRLSIIHRELTQVLAEHLPSCISLEKTFVGENVQSAFRLGEARGAILLAAAQAEVAVVEYSPAEIKVSVAGAGRAAKDQVQAMIGRILALQRQLIADEADALAAALCHLHSRRLATVTALEGVARGRRNRRAAWEQLVRERQAHAR